MKVRVGLNEDRTMNDLIVQAVRDKLLAAEDDLARATRAFRQFSPDEMQKEHGESGQSRASILAGYEHLAAKWRQALAEVEAP